jgi:hypothetical protein
MPRCHAHFLINRSCNVHAPAVVRQFSTTHYGANRAAHMGHACRWLGGAKLKRHKLNNSQGSHARTWLTFSRLIRAMRVTRIDPVCNKDCWESALDRV